MFLCIENIVEFLEKNMDKMNNKCHTITMVYTPYIWPLLIAAFLCAKIALYVRRYPDSPAALPFMWMMWLGVGWTVIYALSIMTLWYLPRLFLSMVMYVPTRLLTPAIFILAVEYTGHDRWLSCKTWTLLLAIPLLSIVASLTSPWHRLFRYNFSLDTTGTFSILHYQGGIIYAISSVFNLLLVLAALTLFLVSLIDRALNRKATLLLFIGILIPITVDTLFNLQITPIKGYSFAPSTIVFTGLAYLIALMKYRLFSFAPIARSTVFDNITDIAVVFDTHGRIIDFNNAAQTCLNLEPQKSMGQDFDALPSEWKDVFKDHFQLSGGRKEISVGPSEQQKIYDLSVSPIKSYRGLRLGFLFLLHDITELRSSEERIKELLREKELLLREVHHRIKNNMSVISSMLSLQSETLSDDRARTALLDARSRLNSMMVLYDKLYRSDGLEALSAADYLSPLIDKIVETQEVAFPVEIHKDIESVVLGARVLFSLGIIVNELIVNAIKHAFPEGRRGTITVALKKIETRLQVWVEDDGGNFIESGDSNGTKGFGLQVVRLMAQQLSADFSIQRGERTRFTLEFPLEDPGTPRVLSK